MDRGVLQYALGYSAVVALRYDEVATPEVEVKVDARKALAVGRGDKDRACISEPELINIDRQDDDVR